MTKKHLIFLGLIFIYTLSFSQIKKEDLNGEWLTVDIDSLYYTADTVQFHLNPNYIYTKDVRYFVEWNIRDSAFYIAKVDSDTEPMFSDRMVAKEELFLYEENRKQKILLVRDNMVIDRFEIISLEEKTIQGLYDKIKILKIVRQRNKTCYSSGA